MIVMLALFPASADGGALDAYVQERLAPTLRAAEGIESVVVGSGPMMSPGGPAPYSGGVVATFSGLEAMMAFAQSPATDVVRKEGESLGVTVLIFEGR